MEVYIDDMLVKSVKAEFRVDHLVEAFQILKDYKMNLKPHKVCLRSHYRKILGVHRQQPRNRGESIENKSRAQHATTF